MCKKADCIKKFYSLKNFILYIWPPATITQNYSFIIT